MIKPFLIANWKNYPDSLEDTKALLKGFNKNASFYRKCHTYIAPPSVYYVSLLQNIKKIGHLASQDISLGQKTHTGEITVDILKNLSVRMAIVGHSERRSLGENSKVVAKKVSIAIKSGITPLVCVGEKEQYQDGSHFEQLRNQIKDSLLGIKRKDAPKLMLAYEPVWAIGKRAKDAISSNDLNQTVIFIKKVLNDLYGRKIADAIPILYGGSAEPGNVEKLYKDTGVRGFLVGHASLSARAFNELVQELVGK